MGAVVSLATAPLSMAATCCGSLAGSCLASMTCKACGCACVASQRVASVAYISLMSLFVLAALICRYDGGDIVIGGGYNSTESSIIDSAMHSALSGGKSYWNQRFWCAAKHPSGWVLCCEDVCGGVYAVYRFSFALCLFFTALVLCTLGSSRFGARAHRGFWVMKAFVLFALLCSTLAIDNNAMQGYREAARYLSMLFLLLQILLLIDFGYGWNEQWLKYDEACESESCFGWKLAILGCTLLLYVGSIAGWVVMYINFGHSGCPAQQALISLTVFFTLVLSIISCTKFAPHAPILTSAVVTGYCTYLCYSALASHTDPTCNPFAERTTSSMTDLLVGLLVAAISMAGTAWSATGSKDALIGKEAGSELTAQLEDGNKQSSSADDEEEGVGSESWWYYHLMMVACSLYMAMLLTDWSAQPVTVNGVPAVHQATGQYLTSLGSFWVKVVSQWVCMLMYAWSLLAPYLLRDYRDFGVEFDFD